MCIERMLVLVLYVHQWLNFFIIGFEGVARTHGADCGAEGSTPRRKNIKLQKVSLLI